MGNREREKGEDEYTGSDGFVCLYAGLGVLMWDILDCPVDLLHDSSVYLFIFFIRENRRPGEVNITIAFKRRPFSGSFLEDPGNMDGFYDQQVPFMVPPNVSKFLLFCRCIKLMVFCFSVLKATLTISVFPQQKSLQVEEPYSRAVNDKKRKLVETELAQDTEGNFNLMNMTNACLADGSDY